ncbi:Aste57867_12832 [Aphanomyces stellatus]|uniref:Aste57867_12832 protein n=1 Tax=Aphanomyces stellatus TaxID=120398 RepID=A0A485KWL3_9STRA|nr:hypothetical protein As57867_012784 [Aphanomyces stellatus]VFT89679.1 Aste57867_12832 [Aphanomyces stellatus]
MTVFAIATTLHQNKFNSANGLINCSTNRAIDTINYITALQDIVQGLAFRHSSVMVSLRTLTTNSHGTGLWYNGAITPAMYLTSVDTLTASLCNDTYWNVLGVDVKNEPFDGTWGLDDAKDFNAGAELE